MARPGGPMIPPAAQWAGVRSGVCSPLSSHGGQSQSSTVRISRSQ
jgi:hypothetical protein